MKLKGIHEAEVSDNERYCSDTCRGEDLVLFRG